MRYKQQTKLAGDRRFRAQKTQCLSDHVPRGEPGPRDDKEEMVDGNGDEGGDRNGNGDWDKNR